MLILRVFYHSISLGFISRPLGRKNRQTKFQLNTLLSRETKKSSVKREGLLHPEVFIAL